MVLTFVLRMVVAAAFIGYGLDKLADRRRFEAAASRFVGGGPLRWTAVLLPLTEVGLGVLVLSGAYAAPAALGVLVLLAVFSAVLVREARRSGARTDCGCSRRPTSIRFALVRNAFLIMCSAAILARPASWQAGVVTGVIESLLVIAAVVPTVRKIVQSKTASAASAHVHAATGSQEATGSQDLGRRTLLRGAVGLAVAGGAALLVPQAAQASVCNCSCIIAQYPIEGECVCGIAPIFIETDYGCCGPMTYCDSALKYLWPVEC